MDEVRKARIEAAVVAAEAEKCKGNDPFASGLILCSQRRRAAAKAVEVMEGRVQQLVHESSVHMSCVAEELTQQLQAEINAAVSSTGCDGAHTEMRAKLLMLCDVNYRPKWNKIWQSRAAENKKRQETVNKITSELDLLKQLNQYKPVFEADAVARETANVRRC